MLKRERRPAKENVFCDEVTLAIDYARKDTKPSSKWQKILPSKCHQAQVPSMYDLEVVQLHMPHLLERRNAAECEVESTTADEPLLSAHSKQRSVSEPVKPSVCKLTSSLAPSPQ